MSSPSPPPARLLYGPISFHGPQSRTRAVSGARFFAIYMVAVGVWALAAGWHREHVLAALAALTYFEVALSGVRGSMLVGDVVYDESQVRRIAQPLFELCGRADCQPPTVVVRNDRIRGAAVRVSQGEKQLVFSGVLVDRLNDRQLRAIIAHEVAHLASGDLAGVRRRGVAGIAIGLAGAVVIGELIGYRSAYSPLYGAGFLWAFLLSRFPLSLLNRRLEIRADEKGAALAGDPVGEAEALTIADALVTEARREIASRYWRSLLFLSPLRWRLPSHPSINDRLARLDRLDVGANGLPTSYRSDVAPYAPDPVAQWSTRIASPPEADVSESSSDPQPPISEWATRSGEPVRSNRRAKLPLLLIAIAAIVFVVLASRSHATSRAPSIAGMSSQAECLAPRTGIAMPLSVFISGGEPPYEVEWTLNGRLDTTDPVSATATTINGTVGQQYTITITPTSDDDTMIATITDAESSPLPERLRVLGPTTLCRTPLPAVGI